MPEKLPLTANVRWVQLGYGALVAVLLHQLYQHFAGVVPLSTGGLVLRFFAIALSFLVFLIYLQNVYRFGLVPDYSKLCRHCHGPVNRYSEFCEHCGADLISPEKLVACPRCGVEVYEDTKYCPECGGLVHKGSRKKSKKGQQPPPPEPEEGWDRPLDAASPPPWEDRRS